MDYKSAGVDIEQGEALVDWLKQPNRPGAGSAANETSWLGGRVVSGIGGFAALFQPDFSQIEEPLLVSATDGIGTKVKLASKFNSYQGVGQDLVAMCVNDLICVGAKPLFFLDYYASSRLELENAKSFLEGVRSACHESLCVLIGGETAEMPGVYQGNDFDAAGFCVGVVDKKKMIQPGLVKAGDRLLGVSSSGFHSNGYSLIRKLFAEDLDQWKDALLQPTALYVKLAEKLKALSGGIHGLAHITGGGIDNLLRVLPSGAVAQLRPWSLPEIFREAEARGQLSREELLKTFNCGVGLVVVLSPDVYDRAAQVVLDEGFESFDLGHIELSGASEEANRQWAEPWEGVKG